MATLVFAQRYVTSNFMFILKLMVICSYKKNMDYYSTVSATDKLLPGLVSAGFADIGQLKHCAF